jgi:N-methylhydantoinase A
MGYRIGVDVGGTFTDFVLADSSSGAVVSFKEPSTPSDPSLAVERGLATLLADNRVAAEEVEMLVHGTTLGLNAVLQRRGAPCMLVVSRGNRDVLELARCRMPSPYNFALPRDEPLLSRDRVLEIGARCDASGRIIARPDAAEYEGVAAAIRAGGADSVAVSLLHAYLEPSMELEVAAALSALLPGVHVTPSTRVWPEIREYERSMLAVMNAYVHPMMDAYYGRLEERLRAAGLHADLYITASNGGTLSVASARERPVDTLLSGPASGVVAACQLASGLGYHAMVSIDMGGTSCDMAVAEGRTPRLTTSAHVGEFPVIAPVVDVSAIGAGGGSVAWVDSQGVLKVGPHSAGADPGPVCYGRGGTRPTITDCFLVTGLVDPAAFLGGRMRLDRDAAAAALAELGARIGYAGEDAAVRTADAAIRVATAMMSTELYKELAQRGVDPRGLNLVAFGGAGPTQAALLAEEARLSGIFVPLAPGTFCAYGAIQSEVRRDFVRSLRRSLAHGETTMNAVREALAQMRTEALEWVATEGQRLGDPVIEASADMRYAGQAYDLSLAIPGGELGGDAGALAEAFHAEHTRLYGFPDRDSQVEVMAVRLSVARALPGVNPVPLPAAESPPTVQGERTLRLRESTFTAQVYHREELRPGHRLGGPAIIEQSDTTVCVLPGWQASVEPDGTLALTLALAAEDAS